MSRPGPLQGQLQHEVMQAVWRLESATVDEVRAALPARHSLAYNTVQTVLNRLAKRGLVERERVGKSFQYRPSLSEAEHLTDAIRHALNGASNEAREAALAKLIGDLERGELSRLRRRAKAIDDRRARR